VSGGLVTLGETMGLLRAAASGDVSQVEDFRLGIGGAESNVAIGVRRLGGAADWIGRVGDDGVGRRILRELRAEGVGALAISDRAPTGLMMKSSRIAGATTVEYFRTGSAGSHLAPEDVDPDVIAHAGVLHVTGITPALSPSAALAVDRALELALAAGVTVSFDVNHREALWPSGEAPDVYRRIAERSNIVFAGETEATLLVGQAPIEELAARIAALGPTQVVIKLGDRGCLALVDGREYRVPAIPIVPVDTVGAGDAFVAGYLAELLDGAAIDVRLATATRAGAFACLADGDWEGLPTRRELGLLDLGDPVIR
jgi:2-dehydro-3-deoxygluconokinase